MQKSNVRGHQADDKAKVALLKLLREKKMSRSVIAKKLNINERLMNGALIGVKSLSSVIIRQKICNFVDADHDELYPEDAAYLLDLRQVAQEAGENFELKVALEWHRKSLRGLSEELGYHRAKIYKSVTISGEDKPPEFAVIRNLIAKSLKVSYEDLWGISFVEDERPDRGLDYVSEAYPAHARLKVALARNGDTILDLAKRLGVAYSSLMRASQGKFRSVKLQSIIAAKIGATPQELWPHIYRDVIKGYDRVNLITDEEITAYVLGWYQQDTLDTLHRRTLYRIKDEDAKSGFYQS